MGNEDNKNNVEDKELNHDGILTAEQELFCLHYTKNDEFRSNGTLAYNEAFNKGLYEKDKTREVDGEGDEIPGTSEYDKCYNVCSAGGSRLLRLLKIQKRVKEILNEMLSNENVDAKLAQIILNGNNIESLGAIREYNKLNQRITDKMEVKGTFSLAELHKQSKGSSENSESNSKEEKNDGKQK